MAGLDRHRTYDIGVSPSEYRSSDANDSVKAWKSIAGLITLILQRYACQKHLCINGTNVTTTLVLKVITERE